MKDSKWLIVLVGLILGLAIFLVPKNSISGKAGGHSSSIEMVEYALKSGTIIQSSYHQRCMMLDGNAGDGETIQVGDCGAGERALWTFEPTLEGAYVVRSRLEDTCLDASVGDAPGFQIGDPIVQWGCHGKASQQWDIETIGEEGVAFKLKSRASGLCAEVLYNNSIIQVDCYESTDQIFRGTGKVGVQLVLDREQYIPEDRVRLDYAFGERIGGELTDESWVGVFEDGYEGDDAAPVELALATADLKAGLSTGSVTLLAPNDSGRFWVQAFLDEAGREAIGPSVALVVQQGGGGGDVQLSDEGVQFCGTMIPYSETVVSCDDLAVTDVSPLLELDRLKSLDLSGSGISDLSVVRHMGSLEYLHIKDTDVSDVSELEGHRSLVFLNIANTRVASIVPLNSIQTLSTVNVSGAALFEDLESGQADVLALRELRPELDIIGVADEI